MRGFFADTKQQNWTYLDLGYFGIMFPFSGKNLVFSQKKRFFQESNDSHWPTSQNGDQNPTYWATDRFLAASEYFSYQH